MLLVVEIGEASIVGLGFRLYRTHSPGRIARSRMVCWCYSGLWCGWSAWGAVCRILVWSLPGGLV